MDTYWADSTGRRNSGFIMLDKEPFEDFNRRLLAKRFAFGIQGMGYCAQIPGCVPAEVGALGGSTVAANHWCFRSQRSR
jgi:hypothetical protein